MNIECDGYDPRKRLRTSRSQHIRRGMAALTLALTLSATTAISQAVALNEEPPEPPTECQSGPSAAMGDDPNTIVWRGPDGNRHECVPVWSTANGW